MFVVGTGSNWTEGRRKKKSPLFLVLSNQTLNTWGWLGLSNQSMGICYVEGAVDRRLKSQVSQLLLGLLLIINSTLGTPSSKLV